jgi:hypothetical protein
MIAIETKQIDERRKTSTSGKEKRDAFVRFNNVMIREGLRWLMEV